MGPKPCPTEHRYGVVALVRTVLTTIACDVCGKSIEATGRHRLQFDNERWGIDLCKAHLDEFYARLSTLLSSATELTPKAHRDKRDSDWQFLEARGFHRHPGRLTRAEREALAHRDRASTRLRAAAALVPGSATPPASTSIDGREIPAGPNR